MKKFFERNFSNRYKKNEKKSKKRFKDYKFKINFKIKGKKLLILKQRKSWTFITIFRFWIIILILIIR